MKNILIILFFLLLNSCAVISFEHDKVYCNPGSDISWFDGESVNFIFSSEVIHYYAEQAVTIKNGNTQISADYEWNGKNLKVKPKEGWISGRIYQIKIEGSVPWLLCD